MDILYPESVTEITPEAKKPVAQDKTKAIKFIKGLVAEKAKSISEIVEAFDKKYIETNDEDYHFLAQDIRTMCEDIDTEWRPKPEPTPIQPIDPVEPSDIQP